MSKTVGAVNIRLDANAQQIVGDFRRAEVATSRFGQRGVAALRPFQGQIASTTATATALQTTLGRLAMFGAPLTFAGAAGGIRRLVAEMGQLANAADRAGLQSAEALQVLRFAGEQTGATVAEVDRAIADFSRRIAEAAARTGQLRDVLEANGVALRDNEGRLRSTEDLLRDFAELLRRTRDEQDRLRLAAMAFGDRGGRALVNALRNGAVGLEEFERMAREGGRVIEEDLVQKSRDLDDQFHRLSTTLSTTLKSAILDATHTGIERFERWLRIVERLAEHFEEVASLLEHIAEIARRILFFTASDILGELLDRGAGTVEGVLPPGPPRARPTPPGAAPSEPETVIPTRPDGGDRAGAVQEVADALDCATESVRRHIEALEIEAATIGMGRREAERYRVTHELLNEAKRAGREITPELSAEIEGLASRYADVVAAIEKAAEALHDQEQAAKDAARAFSDFARDAIMDFGNMEDAASRLLKRIADLILEMTVLRPLRDALGGFFQRGFAGRRLSRLTLWRAHSRAWNWHQRQRADPREPGGVYRKRPRHGPASAAPPCDQPGPAPLRRGRPGEGTSLPRPVAAVGEHLDAAGARRLWRPRHRRHEHRCPGADPAALQRVEAEVARLQNELPSRVIRAVQEAESDRAL